MGNSIVHETEDGVHTFHTIEIDDGIPEIHDALAIVGQVMGSLTRQTSTTMPIIRKKPDLSTFRHTEMYKEIKALCGMHATRTRPINRWSLTRELQKRENGLPGNAGVVFNENQQRAITNFYVPNEKDERLMSLESKIFVCKFDSSGSKLLTACQDGLIRIFDSSKGTYHRINRLKAKEIHWSILDADFSPCGQYFAYCSWNDQIIVAPVNGTQEDFQWIDLRAEMNRCGLFSIKFSPDGKTIIGGSNHSALYICDRETQVVSTLFVDRSFQTDINALSYVSDTDSNVFVTGCNNGLLKLWDTRTPTRRNTTTTRQYRNPLNSFLGHLDGITYIDSRNDGHYLLTNSKDQSIKLWDLRKPTPMNKLSKAQNLPSMEWDYRWDSVPREYYNPTASLDGDVSVMTYRGHRVTKSLLRAKFSPKIQTGQRYIYTGCGTGRIIIYDVLTGYIKEAIEGHKDIVRDVSWHPVRSEIVSSSWDTHVNLITFKRNKLLKRSNSDHVLTSRRRSRRIAHQNGELDDFDDED